MDSVLMYAETRGKGKVDARFGSCTCYSHIILLVYVTLDESDSTEMEGDGERNVTGRQSRRQAENPILASSRKYHLVPTRIRGLYDGFAGLRHPMAMARH